jgi:hypothetical protein
VDETYRMLGRERQADLEREAERSRTAALAPRTARRVPTFLALPQAVRMVLGVGATAFASSIQNVRLTKGG